MKKRGLIAILIFALALVAGVFAACDRDQYTITFVTNGADPIAPITAEAGAQITPPEAPVRVGYKFGGWYLEEDFSGDAQVLPTVMPSENRTYYAKFEASTCTLTLDLNGGTLATTSYSVEYGTKLLEFLKELKPTRAGLRFAGWYIGGRIVLANDSVQEDVTVVAQWEAPYTVEVYLQQLNEAQTAASDNYVLSEEHTTSGWALLGEEFDASIYIENYVLFSGHSSSVLFKVIEEENNAFKLYYRLRTYTIFYNANAHGFYTGEMALEEYPHGAIVQLKDCAYSYGGYRFAAWSLLPNELLTPPTTAFRITNNYTIYALWDREYVNEEDAADVIYVSAVVQSGLGRVYRLENDVKAKEGFLKENVYIPGVFEFTFYLDEGDEIGKIDAKTGTFRYRGEEEGIYAGYDYATEEYVYEVLYLDGYGETVWGTVDIAGGIHFGNNYGNYTYEETYGDYRFNYVDIYTQEETGDFFYFRVFAEFPEIVTGQSSYAGIFMVQGYESGTYLLYEVFYSELDYSYVLELDGYGNARELYVDPQSGDPVLLSEGTYRATENYEDYMGEWEYVSSGSTALSRFILNSVANDNDSISVYLMYDESLAGTLAAASGSAARLVLGGYNAAVYYPNGLSGNAISGAFVVSNETNLFFTPYEDGVPSGRMLFEINWAAEGNYIGTFTLNESGYIVNNGTLTGYMGTSSYLEIPDSVTAIAEDALNYNHIEVSLRSVVIPASVLSIGARAFENEYTLSQAVFLATVPIDIDWSNTVNPFRWPKGDFVIIVPEGYEDVYRAAWADCPYRITSFTELNNRPEWEIEDGVLIAYNNKDENPHDLDLTIPEEVTEIAAGVFFALDYIRSVNLNNVITIGENAFAQCAALVSVTAPRLRTVGDGAFALCTALHDISLPAVVTLGEETFSGCYLLTRVTLGEGIAEIGAAAFAYCATEAEDEGMMLFVVLEGANVPSIGGNAFYGCVARRVSVGTIETALAFYGASDWYSYRGLLWVREAAESELVGEWVNLGTLEPVTFDGRAELFLIEVWLYKVSGSSVTFYIANSSARGYTTISGTYQNGEISFVYSTLKYVLVRADEPVTYTNGNETLTLNFPEADYANYPFLIPATFNGVPVTVSVTFNGITADGVVIGGRSHKVTFTLTNERTFSYTSRPNDMIGPYTASDGSVVSFRYDGALIYATGTLTVDGNVITGTVGWITAQENDTTFNISLSWRSTNYLVTVVITGNDTFTYSWVVGSTRKVISSSNGAGAVIAVYGRDGALSTLQLMLPATSGGTSQTVDSTYVLQEDGSYLFYVNFDVEYYDETTGEVYTQPSPLNGTYLVTIDFDGETCTIIKQS